MFRSDFLFLKGLQTPLETAGKEITSFKVEAHLKDGCVERKTLKGRGRREVVSVCTGMFGANHFKCHVADQYSTLLLSTITVLLACQHSEKPSFVLVS